MKNWLKIVGLGIASFGLFVHPAHSAVVTFTGTDVAAGPGAPTPIADSAAAAFAAAAGALGGITTITFEGAPLGPFSNLPVAPGVTINGDNYGGNTLYVSNTPNFPTAPALDGFNTTPGGAYYVELIGGNLVFTFAVPTQFFGAYFTGIQPGFFSDYLSFTDSNGLQTVSVSNPTAYDGGVTFVGFVDAGELITSVTFVSGGPGYGDFSGIDDVSYQTIPEPSSLTLVGVAIAGGAIHLFKRRRNV